MGNVGKIVGGVAGAVGTVSLMRTKKFTNSTIGQLLSYVPQDYSTPARVALISAGAGLGSTLGSRSAQSVTMFLGGYSPNKSR